ncbi:uncharacterized protein B0H64DRAFT_210984 [Chaetomium fimeti]|uniref:Uncharacterized protein n=1 Tax=Chaetomium fimeti TaxID=1854472 RepID=A0AAE0HD01_9PEZI|nr:hypothetical protein B0H64DRAFT_210984 [Chaetomium fimeti]
MFPFYPVYFFLSFPTDRTTVPQANQTNKPNPIPCPGISSTRHTTPPPSKTPTTTTPHPHNHGQESLRQLCPDEEYLSGPNEHAPNATHRTSRQVRPGRSERDSLVWPPNDPAGSREEGLCTPRGVTRGSCVCVRAEGRAKVEAGGVPEAVPGAVERSSWDVVLYVTRRDRRRDSCRAVPAWWTRERRVRFSHPSSITAERNTGGIYLKNYHHNSAGGIVVQWL